jgi:hypothetical protein
MTSSPRPHPLIELVLVRLRDFYREPATVFCGPLLALALGCVSQSARPVRVLVVDAGARVIAPCSLRLRSLCLRG